MEPKNETKPKVVQIRPSQKDKTTKPVKRIIVRGSGPRPGGDAA